jgi:hypothetical protein
MVGRRQEKPRQYKGAFLAPWRGWPLVSNGGSAGVANTIWFTDLISAPGKIMRAVNELLTVCAISRTNFTDMQARPAKIAAEKVCFKIIEALGSK